MLRKLLYFSFAATFLLGGVWAIYETGFFSRPENKLQANNPQIVAEGKVIYLQECAACHGKNLEGQENWKVRNEYQKLPAPPHNQEGHTWHHSDEALINMTKKGPKSVAGPNYLTDMPAYEKRLTHDQIVAVLSYIKSTWPDKNKVRQNKTNPSLD